MNKTTTPVLRVPSPTCPSAAQVARPPRRRLQVSLRSFVLFVLAGTCGLACTVASSPWQIAGQMPIPAEEYLVHVHLDEGGDTLITVNRDCVIRYWNLAHNSLDEVVDLRPNGMSCMYSVLDGRALFLKGDFGHLIDHDLPRARIPDPAPRDLSMKGGGGSIAETVEILNGILARDMGMDWKIRLNDQLEIDWNERILPDHDFKNISLRDLFAWFRESMGVKAIQDGKDIVLWSEEQLDRHRRQFGLYNVALFDLEKRNLLARFQTDEYDLVEYVVCSKNGSSALIISTRKIWHWDFTRSQPTLLTLPQLPAFPKDYFLNCVSGDYLVVQDNQTGCYALWHKDGAAPVRVWPGSTSSSDHAIIDPAGEWMAVFEGENGSAHWTVSDLHDHSRKTVLPAEHPRWSTQHGYHVVNDALLSAAGDHALLYGATGVLSKETMRVTTLEHGKYSHVRSISPDGERLIVNEADGLYVLDAASGKILQELVDDHEGKSRFDVWSAWLRGEEEEKAKEVIISPFAMPTYGRVDDEHPAWTRDGTAVAATINRDEVRVWRRTRPEAWYGLLWLPSCWLSLLFVGLMLHPLVTKQVRRTP